METSKIWDYKTRSLLIKIKLIWFTIITELRSDMEVLSFLGKEGNSDIEKNVCITVQINPMKCPSLIILLFVYTSP